MCNTGINSIINTIDTGIAHSQVTLDYLREEGNSLPRVVAVAIGGLTGLIFSLRGGKFKKFLYTTTAGTTVAAICYPKEAQEAIHASKHYINIVYNFIYGVKPGDSNQKEINWPKFPPILNLPIENDAGLVARIKAIINYISTIGTNKEELVPKETSSEKK